MLYFAPPPPSSYMYEFPNQFTHYSNHVQVHLCMICHIQIYTYTFIFLVFLSFRPINRYSHQGIGS